MIYIDLCSNRESCEAGPENGAPDCTRESPVDVPMDRGQGLLCHMCWMSWVHNQSHNAKNL